ncbi:MAG: hypothetical protein ABI056_07465 [Caulobacteraceae bacterium]
MADKPSGGLTGVALWVAIVVIAAWLGMLAWLVQQVGASEVIWSRLLVVL